MVDTLCMPWGSKTVIENREEFRALASCEGSNISELCRRYGISRTSGYKWLSRVQMEDESRRPKHSPFKTCAEVESEVIALRNEHPVWGGRKLRRVLLDQGVEGVPSASTITEILRRHGLLTGPGANEVRDWQRFERSLPNELWQMDFKGHFQLLEGRCHPLTVLDDCSRFSLVLKACSHETGSVVQEALTAAFRTYGLPLCILCDNGGPWGSKGEITKLGVWMMRLGIRLYHGRPYHPQTQGKEERFHRTLKSEVILNRSFKDIEHCQRTFDPWRHCYNTKRPHEALDLDTPISRYRSSVLSFPDTLPEIQYDSIDEVKTVRQEGVLYFQGGEFRVGKGLIEQRVGVRPSSQDGIYEVRFANQIIALIDVRHNTVDQATVNHVPERL